MMITWLYDPAIPDDAADTSWLRDITISQVIGALLIVGAAWFVVHRVVKAFRPVRDFLDDWNGERQRPGVPPRPGVMARLDTIEAHFSDAPTRREFDEAKAEHVRDITDVRTHLVRLDVQVAQVLPPPGVHHTVTTVTSSSDPEHHPKEQ